MHPFIIEHSYRSSPATRRTSPYVLCLRPALNRMGCAVSEMISHQRSRNRSKSLLRRRHLRQNFGAVAIFFNHALKAADLALDTPQASEIRRLNLRINADRLTIRDSPHLAGGTLIGDNLLRYFSS